MPEHIQKNPVKSMLVVFASCLACGGLWFFLGRTAEDFLKGVGFPIFCCVVPMIVYLPGFFLGRKEEMWEIRYKNYSDNFEMIFLEASKEKDGATNMKEYENKF